MQREILSPFCVMCFLPADRKLFVCADIANRLCRIKGKSMLKKVLLKRIIQIIIVLIGVSFLTFCLVYIAPGDPATAMFEAAGISPTPEMLGSRKV